MTLTKGRSVNSLHYRLGLPKRRSATIVEIILGSFKSRLEKKEDVLFWVSENFVLRTKRTPGKKSGNRGGYHPGNPKSNYVQEFRGF